MVDDGDVTFAAGKGGDGAPTSAPVPPAPETPRTPLIVVHKRARAVGHGGAGHSGGSWKIAYADFVTAMMAFFLLMWLLSSTNKSDLQGIADYFNRPLASAFQNGPGASATTAPQTANAAKTKNDAQQLEELKKKLDALIQQSAKLSAFKNQIKIEVTSEGLRIQIVDDKNRPMFDQGSTSLKDYTRTILEEIGAKLNDVDNRISIAGHTDSLTYSAGAGAYSNWELSSERANAARRELVSGGMKPDKVLQVRGFADELPLFKNDPENPGNRRISIVVLNRETEANLLRDGQREIPASALTPAP